MLFGGKSLNADMQIWEAQIKGPRSETKKPIIVFKNYCYYNIYNNNLNKQKLNYLLY